MGLSAQSACMKPTIRIIGGEIHRVVDAAELELANSGQYYQQGGLIVAVTTDPGTQETRVQDMRQSALVRALAGVASWEKYDARAQDWVRTDPPARHAAVLYDSIVYRHLPVIKGLARQPYLRSGGKNAYQQARRALMPDSRDMWDEAVEDEEYPANAEGLEDFIDKVLWSICYRMEKEARYQAEIKAQTFGEGLKPQQLEKLNRYEIHLDRKFERTLAMLLKLKDIRIRSNVNSQNTQNY